VKNTTECVLDAIAVERRVSRRVRPMEIAEALRDYQQGDIGGVMVLVSRQACEEGAEWLERLNRETEVFYHERQHARACLDNAVRLLSGIHALLYPAAITAEDGRTMVFRPKDQDPHEVLQALSNRIRALPDELARIERHSDRLPGSAADTTESEQ
jgi:hypothetical protein